MDTLYCCLEWLRLSVDKVCHFEEIKEPFPVCTLLKQRSVSGAKCVSTPDIKRLIKNSSWYNVNMKSAFWDQLTKEGSLPDGMWLFFTTHNPITVFACSFGPQF